MILICLDDEMLFLCFRLVNYKNNSKRINKSDGTLKIRYELKTYQKKCQNLFCDTVKNVSKHYTGISPWNPVISRLNRFDNSSRRRNRYTTIDGTRDRDDRDG